MINCTLCGAELTPTTGYKYKRNKSGYRSWCRECTKSRNNANYAETQSGTTKRRLIARKSHLKHKYGITIAEYDAMFADQGGVCAICQGTTKHKYMQWSTLVVDHDHTTGQVRGLLCHPCNVLLGKAQDSATILRAAADYLIKNERI